MRAVLLAIASVGVMGCIGSLDSMEGGSVGTGTNPNPTGPTSMARTMFEQGVYPIIKAGTAASDCSECHDAKAPSGNTVGFVAETVDDAYATITSFQQVVGNFTPAEAGIVTQVNAGHNARMYTQAQMTTITNWLNQEVTERAGTTSTTTNSESATARVLNQFSSCMTLDDFNAANMATAWGQMTAQNNSKCESCHATGYNGFIATEIATTTTSGTPGLFTTISTNEAYMMPYFTVDLSGGDAAAKVIINTVAFVGVSQAQPPHVEHPMFNAMDNNGMTALTTFYNSVMTKVMAAGTANCGPVLLTPPAT
jgi:hypothetical protein